MTSPRKPRVGLVLGSGSARGWAHFGVIRALEETGIRPDIVCGTSIGALVGAAYAAGELDRFEQWVRQLKVMDVAWLPRCESEQRPGQRRALDGCFPPRCFGPADRGA